MTEDAPTVAEVLARGLSESEALSIATEASNSPLAQRRMFELARQLRDNAISDRRIAFCGILQAKLGGCAEDCAFCCQSAHHGALAGWRRPLASLEIIVTRARTLAAMGARAFSIVTAGRRLADDELDVVCHAVETVRAELGLECCASLGRLDEQAFTRLREAGLQRYHHNLETAASHFPSIISTYHQEDSLETIARAKRAGLTICSSGVFGLGESLAQRVELIGQLKTLQVEGAPLCFLEPHPETPLADRPLLDVDEALRIIALHRLMLPAADIIVTGGRIATLGARREEVLDAGANGVMVGDYPTSFGGDEERDRAMIRRAHFKIRPPRLR